jgi:hypothetical protein
MKSVTMPLLLSLLMLAASAPAQESKADLALDKTWRERVVGGWRFEHRSSTKEGAELRERTEIRFGADGRYSAVTAITSPVEPIKLASSGTFEVTAIDASRARLRLVHASTDPSVLKEELTETLEITAKDKTTLVFPGNAVLTSIP